MSTKEYLLVITGSAWSLVALGLYFFVFNGDLSNKAGDWGSFGGYVSGIITVPFSIISAYFLFKTYRNTRQAYDLAIEEKRINISHDAIREAAAFLEISLDSRVVIGENELSFREINYNPKAAREIMVYIKTHSDLNAHYRSTVGKSFLCLYDFLRTSENVYGQTDIIRFFKIQYQWIIHLHNEFELDVIESKENGILSRDIEKYFYAT